MKKVSPKTPLKKIVRNSLLPVPGVLFEVYGLVRLADFQGFRHGGMPAANAAGAKQGNRECSKRWAGCG